MLTVLTVANREKCIHSLDFTKSTEKLLSEARSMQRDPHDSEKKVYYVPLLWAADLVNRARAEGRIKDDFALKTLIKVCYEITSCDTPIQTTTELYIITHDIVSDRSLSTDAHDRHTRA